jgi:hypothetical protein
MMERFHQQAMPMWCARFGLAPDGFRCKAEGH